MKIWQVTLYGNQGYIVRAETIAEALSIASKKEINIDKAYMVKQVPYHPYRLREEDMTDDETDFPTRAEVST